MNMSTFWWIFVFLIPNVLYAESLSKESLGQEIGFRVVKQHTVNIRDIHYLAVDNGSLWIGEDYREHKTVQHIKIVQDQVKTLSTYRTKVYGLATSPSGSTYIVKGGSTLGIINPTRGQIIDAKFNVQPWIITCVHVTRDHSVIVGATIPRYNHGIVIVMNSQGRQIKTYEYDHGKQLFKYPQSITTTSMGTIVVGDRHEKRVVVLQPGGNVGYYHGHPDVNSRHKPMEPMDLLTTPNDNILVLDYITQYIHILNNEGKIITYYNLNNIGIFRPYSLALAPSGYIYLGCVSARNAPIGTKAKLYELAFNGF